MLKIKNSILINYIDKELNFCSSLANLGLSYVNEEFEIYSIYDEIRFDKFFSLLTEKQQLQIILDNIRYTVQELHKLKHKE